MPNATILHISDIHRTPDESTSNSEILSWLTADLDRHRTEGIPTPDVVVVSGDVSQSGETAQYDEAASFLRGLLDHLQLPLERLVVVPGNHDVHWRTCEDFVRSRREFRGEVEKTLGYSMGSSRFTYESEQDFQARLSNFRRFYKSLTNQEYPSSREESFTSHDFDSLGISIYGLSSLDHIDHQRFTAGFSADAVRAASLLASRTENLPVVIWHHDLDWDHGNQDCLPPGDLRLLSTGPFKLGLCGHTHRPANNDVHRIDGYPLPVVAAGSLCAGARQRPESTARSYNVIRIQDGSARVWVRAKDTRTNVWRDLSVFGSPTERRSWYDISLSASTRPSEGDASQIAMSTRRIGELRTPNPFANINAKQASRRKIVSDYVWTRVAEEARVELPQIVVGTRGSGKTALLLTLTMDAQLIRVSSSVARDSPVELDLRTIGLYCPMKINDVTAFNGKGSVSLSDRKSMFRAAIASMWAVEMADALSQLSSYIRANRLPQFLDEHVVSSLATAWGLSPSEASFEGLRASVRTLRDRVLHCLGSTCGPNFESLLQEVLAVPLARGGLGPLDDAARELQKLPIFRETRWVVLFDEVEFLNVWQQECVYEHMSNPSSNTSCKVATLPYAHSRALSEFPSVLVLGEDYGELSVLIGDETDFEKVALGLWQSRLDGWNAPPLSEVWPEEEYSIILARHLGEVCDDDLLIQDLPHSRRATADRYRREDPSKFGNEFSRKYREPFRFRLAEKVLRERGITIPLYWGWKQMLKACGNNPRQFLRLADICWNSYWRSGNVRPLSPEEQFIALCKWAESFAARCESLPHKGHELQSIVSQVATKLSARIYSSASLRNEYLSVEIEDCHQDQAEAIAIGIAYGFLIPRMSEDSGGRPMFPSSEIVMRLGYPVAVSKRLPLRQGEVLTIKTMRQLELSWWSE